MSSTFSIAATNPALASGAITQPTFFQGLSSFFYRAAHGFIRDGLDIVQLDCLVGQQAQCPTSTPLRGLAATHRDQMRFKISIHLALVPTRSGLALQCGFKALCHKTLLDAVDLAGAYVQDCRNFLAAAPTGQPLRGVAVEQYQRIAHLGYCMSAFADQSFKLLALFGVQCDNVFFHPSIIAQMFRYGNLFTDNL